MVSGCQRGGGCSGRPSGGFENRGRFTIDIYAATYTNNKGHMSHGERERRDSRVA